MQPQRQLQAWENAEQRKPYLLRSLTMESLATLFAAADSIADYRSAEEQQVLAAEYAAVLAEIEDLVSDELREEIALEADAQRFEAE